MVNLRRWQVTIPGTPAPWTVWAKRGTQPAGYTNMVRWHQTVALWTFKAQGKPVTTHPVSMCTQFFIPKPRRPAHPWPSRGDLTNLLKAAEDALQGILYYNDNQVQAHYAAKYWTTPGPFGAPICQEDEYQDPLIGWTSLEVWEIDNNGFRLRESPVIP